jgi:hypothetical protein
VVQVVSGVAVHLVECIKSVNLIFNLGFCFEWHMESEGRSDEVVKVVPVSLLLHKVG